MTDPDAPDLAALFDTPQVTTDGDGRHWHNGREYDAVTVDGELTYTPKGDCPGGSSATAVSAFTGVSSGESSGDDATSGAAFPTD